MHGEAQGVGRTEAGQRAAPGPGTQLVSLLGLSSLLKAGITVSHAWA